MNSKGQGLLEMTLSMALLSALLVVFSGVIYGMWAGWILETQMYEWILCRNSYVSKEQKVQNCQQIFERRIRLALPFSKIQKVRYRETSDHRYLEIEIQHWKNKNDRLYRQQLRWPLSQSNS